MLEEIEIPTKPHWKYPAVPEAKISKLAIKRVAEKLGISEEWIKRAHDFQWQYAHDALAAGKTLHIPCMMRFQVNGKPINTEIKELLKRRDYLERKIEKTENKIIACSSSIWKAVKYTRRKGFEETLLIFQEELKTVQARVDELVDVMVNKAGRTKYKQFIDAGGHKRPHRRAK